MKSLFTIHAGEYLAGSFIEKKFKNVNVWVPSKDTGIDLLVTDAKNNLTVSLQVKFSRDFLSTNWKPIFQHSLRACGWWNLNRKKIIESSADYWVFALLGFNRQSTDFVVIPASKLLERLDSIHGQRDRIQHYLWVTKDNKCWETRGLKKPDQLKIAEGCFSSNARNFSEYLNDWTPIEKLNR